MNTTKTDQVLLGSTAGADGDRARHVETEESRLMVFVAGALNLVAVGLIMGGPPTLKHLAVAMCLSMAMSMVASEVSRR